MVTAGLPARKLDDCMARLLMRMLLLYIQQAPVHRANHSIQQALALLPVLLGTSVDALNRCAPACMFCIYFRLSLFVHESCAQSISGVIGIVVSCYCAAVDDVYGYCEALLRCKLLHNE